VESIFDSTVGTIGEPSTRTLLQTRDKGIQLLIRQYLSLCNNLHTKIFTLLWSLSVADALTKSRTVMINGHQLMLERVAQPSETEADRTDTVQLPIEQLLFLDLLLRSYELREISSFTEVDVTNKCIYIRGSAKTNASTQCRINKSLKNSNNGRVDLSINLIGSFQTDVGRVWVESLMSKNKSPAVFYVTEGTGYIIAKDGESLVSACKVLQRSIVTEHLTIDSSLRVFISSATFTDIVGKFQTNKIVDIETDGNCVTIQGRKEDVQHLSLNLQTFMNECRQFKMSVSLNNTAERRLLEEHHKDRIMEHLNSR